MGNERCKATVAKVCKRAIGDAISEFQRSKDGDIKGSLQKSYGFQVKMCRLVNTQWEGG